MRNWEKIRDYHYTQGPEVHEVRCPYCGFKETYTNSEPPAECYLCNERLEVPA